MAKKPIQGIHWYNVLANPTYIQDFAYISCSIPDRSDYIVDDDEDEDNDNEQSDLVKIALNLAYVDDRHVKDLVIGAGIQKKMKSIKKGKDISSLIGKKLISPRGII